MDGLINAGSYQRELLAILRAHSEQALKTLRALDAAIPEKTRAIHIGIHPNQEQDGTFSIMIHLDGPDLYVLNKAIDAHRYLFEVRYGEDGCAEPEVPLFSPFHLPFEVNDVIVDTCFLWLEELWKCFGGTKSNLPVEVFGEDGYGSEPFRQLSTRDEG